MNSNYHFQKHQANEQIQRRLQEAEYHRMSKKEDDRSSVSFLTVLTVPLLLGILVAIFLLTGCTPGDVLPEEAASRADASPKTTMADRIHFQDARVAKFEAHQEGTSAGEMTMAARIHFQDKRAGDPTEELVVESSSEWTMAERIQFQDRVQEQDPQ